MLRMLNIHASSPTDLAGLLFDLPGLDPVLVCLSFISELITPYFGASSWKSVMPMSRYFWRSEGLVAVPIARRMLVPFN